MGLFKNLKLKSEHVKRVGGFARAVENGLSEKEAWDYVNRIYPPSPELVEYEAKVLGVSRWGSEPQSDPSIEEEEPEPRTDKEESEPRTEEEVRMFLAATHLAVESSAEDLAAIDSSLSWVLDSLDDWKFCLKSAVINLVLVRTMSDQAQHGEAVKALDSDLDRLDPNLKGAFQNFLG